MERALLFLFSVFSVEIADILFLTTILMIKFLPDFTVALKSRKQEQENGIEARLLRFVRFERRNLFGLILFRLYAIKCKEEKEKVLLSHACLIRITLQYLDRTEYTSYKDDRFLHCCNNE